jgi:hypothetical protein
LGSANVTTSAGGSASFTLPLAAVVPAGQIITASATDPAGNTSSMAWGTAVTLTSTVNDGIPDAWRAAKFGGNGMTTNAVSCATCNPDNDRAGNWREFRSNTNPNSEVSELALNPPTRSGTDLMVSFRSAAGVTYRLLGRNALGSGTWSILADQILGTGSAIQLTDPGAAAWDGRYYELQVLP